jgi:hypothetical protein
MKDRHGSLSQDIVSIESVLNDSHTIDQFTTISQDSVSIKSVKIDCQPYNSDNKWGTPEEKQKDDQAWLAESRYCVNEDSVWIDQ